MLFFILAIFIASLSIFFSSYDDSITLILSIIYFLITSFIIFENYKKNHVIEFLNPLIFYALLWSIPFGVIPVLISFSEDPSSILFKSSAYIEEIPASQVMAIIGLIFLYLGFRSRFYSLFLSNIRKDNNLKKWKSSLVYFTILLYIILTGITIVYLLQREAFFLGATNIQEHTPSITTYLLNLFGFSRISVFYLFGTLLIAIIAYSYSKNVILKLILIGLSFSNILLGVVSAHKERIGVTLFVWLFYFYYLKDKNFMNIRKEFIIVVVILLFITTFPLFNAYRTALNLGMQIESPIQAIEVVKQAFNYIDIPEGYKFIFVRFDHLNTNIAVIGQSPNFVEFKIGDTYIKGLEAILSLIPKTQKSKDFGRFNNTFAMEYGLVEPWDYVSGVTLPQISEIYMNFGFFMIPILMFLYGVFYKIIYEVMTKINSPNVKFIGFIFFYIWVFQHSALAFSTTMIMQLGVLYGLMITLFILNLDRVLNKVVK